MSVSNESISSFIARQRRLLALEREEELAALETITSSATSLSAMDAAGIAITRLSVSGRRMTPGGRATIELSTRGGRIISAPRLSTGDIVRVCAHHSATSGAGAGRRQASGAEKGVQGVLCKMEDQRVEVVVDGGDGGGGDDEMSFGSEPGVLWCVIQVGSDVTVKRSNAALDELEKATSSPAHPAYALCGVLYRGAEARLEKESSLKLTEGQRTLLGSLDNSQTAAVKHAMLCKDLAVIHGPPGTGKSTTVASFVGCEVLRGARCLVVAPSNVAADGIAEKLATLPCRIRFVRAGHPARILPAVAPHTLEARLAQTDEALLAKDVRAEMAAIEAKASSVRGGERRALWAEKRVLRKELRVREGQAIKRLLGNVDVVVATTTGAGSSVLRHATAGGEYDVVVVDEAGQASEVSALIAILRGRKAVLAGDPFQLAPTIMCDAAEKGGLGCTLLDRIFARPDLLRATTRILQTQYRSNEVISDWSSEAFYGGRVKAAPTVAGHLLKDLVHLDIDGEMRSQGESSEDADSVLAVPWVLMDTAGCGFDESGDDDESGMPDRSRSRSNIGEADTVVHQVRVLLEAGVAAHAIGVISPYAGQVRLIRSKLRGCVGRAADVEVATVDSYQGREKEAVLLSLVRSNDRGSVGFLGDARRLNVAITRARRLVFIVTNSATTSSDDFVSAMIDYASEHGDYRCANPDINSSDPVVSQWVEPGPPKSDLDHNANTRSTSQNDKRKRKGKTPRKKKSSEATTSAEAQGYFTK